MSEGENDPEYLTCECKECGNYIEFPAASLRDTVSCPHCGEWTELIVPGQGEPKEKSDGINLFALILWIVLPLIVVVGLILFIRHKTTTADQVRPPIKVAAKPVALPKPVVTNLPATNTAPAKPQPLAKPRPKSFADLKVSEITIDKANEGKLIYAVGTVTNDSDFQRFGVKIQLDLISLQGSKIGTAQDYLSILEPRKEWHFHALVTEPRAVAARITSLKEEE